MTTRASRRGLLRRATVTRGVLPFTLAVYSGALLPPASRWTGAHVFVSDDVGGGVEAFSDGVNWRRVTDRAVISPVVTASMYAPGTASATCEGRAGPWGRSAGVAVGTLAGASRVAASLYAAGVAVATGAFVPLAQTALSGAGSAVGALRTQSLTAAAMSAAGTAAGVCSLVGAP